MGTKREQLEQLVKLHLPPEDQAQALANVAAMSDERVREVIECFVTANNGVECKV